MLEYLKGELTSYSPLEFSESDIMNVVSFAYLMNYDDKDLWIVLHHIAIELLKDNRINLQNTIKLLGIIDADTE